jgi:hypothetical protein
MMVRGDEFLLHLPGPHPLVPSPERRGEWGLATSDRWHYVPLLFSREGGGDEFLLRSPGPHPFTLSLVRRGKMGFGNT